MDLGGGRLAFLDRYEGSGDEACGCAPPHRPARMPPCNAAVRTRTQRNTHAVRPGTPWRWERVLMKLEGPVEPIVAGDGDRCVLLARLWLCV